MKLSVKKDLLLRELYKFKFNDKWYNIQEIAQNSCIEGTYREFVEICKSLKTLDLVKFRIYAGGSGVQISSYGVEYCENDSFTFSDKPIISNIYNISIENSPNTTVVNGSENVQINRIDEITSLLEKICTSIQISSEVNEDLQSEMLGRIAELQDFIAVTKKVPRYGITDLISVGANMATLSQYFATLQGVI